MKRNVFFMIIAVAVVSACQKENKANENPTTMLEFGIESPLTKTDLAGTVNIRWTSGDKISVDTESGMQEFTLVGAGGSASGTFAADGTLSVNTSATAFYPSTMSPNYTDSWHVNLPDSYNWTENGIQAPMYAWINGAYNYFKLLTSVIKVDVYNIPSTASKLEFTSASEQVSGDYAFSSDAIAVVTSAGNKTITINFTAGESTFKTFFIPVPYGTYPAGATIKLKDSSDNELVTKTTPSAITVAKQSIAFFPAVNCTSTSAGTVLFSGSHDVASWSSNVFSHSASFAEGDILRFTFSLDETVGGSAATYWQLQLGYNNPWTEVVTFGIPSGVTSCDMILTSAQADAFNTHSEMYISGYAVTVTNIELVHPEAETVLWTGSVDFGNWAESFNEAGMNSSALWANITTGKKLSVYYTTTADSGQLYIKSASGWNDISGLCTNIPSNSNHISFTLTEEQVTSVKTAGIVMQGSNLSITKVTIK